MSTQTTEAPAVQSQGILSYLTGQLRTVGLLVAFIVIIAFMQVSTGGTLLEPFNVTAILSGNAYILILAIGMVMVIIAGHIDLSVGSVVALVGAITGIVCAPPPVGFGLPWWLAVIVGIISGALIGAWQGLWVAYVGIPAFIVTLAGMLTFRGLAQMLLKNVPITPFPDEYVAIGAGFVPSIGPADMVDVLTIIVGTLLAVGMVVLEVRSRAASAKVGLEVEPFAWFVIKSVSIVLFIGSLTWMLANYRGIPIVLVVLGVLVAMYTLVMNRSVFGRNIYARGGNLHAAQLSGVNTKKVDFLLFVNMGVLGAIAGIAFTARSNSAGPGAGLGFELDAIAACFIGGAAVTGGVGTVVGAMLGGLIMAVLNYGMFIMGVGTDVQQFIKGFVLLAAVAFDIFNKTRSGRSK